MKTLAGVQRGTLGNLYPKNSFRTAEHDIGGIQIFHIEWS